jgi:hypothetical protein
MRRPPEVGQAGILVILLLGASGCAGFPQRTIGIAPGSAPADGQAVSPPGLFSWWHRTSSRNAANETASAGQPETANPGQRYPSTNEPAANPWPESQSEWVARNFPRFNRIWNGAPNGRPAEVGGPADDLSTSRTPNNRPTPETPVTAAVPRSDRAVQPTEGPSSDDTRSNADRPGVRAQNPDNLPFSPTPPPVKSPRQSMPQPASETAAVNDERAVPIPSDVTESAERAALQPKPSPPVETQQPPVETQQPPVEAQPPPKEIEPDSAIDRTSSQPLTLDDFLPAPATAGPQQTVSSDPGSNRPSGSTDATVEKPALEPQPAPEPIADTRMAQAPPPPTQRTTPAPPPPPPPSQRTAPAPAPSPAGGDRPASSPPEPPAPAAATPTEAPRPAEAAPASPTASAPAPVPTTSQAQLPPAAFPATYSSRQNVLPTGQGNAVACETTDKAPKKPCFLKVWIHDWKSGHGWDDDGCGHGGLCASAQSNAATCETAHAPKKPCFLKVWIHDWKNGKQCSHGDGCGHGAVTASPQAPAVCETAAKAPKKPCFLKVWIHDWKNGHGSGCDACQKGGGSCCQSGKSCGGGGSPVSASGQGSIAAAQATGQVYSRP